VRTDRDRSGQIVEVAERRNFLARRSAGQTGAPQVIAANCDLMVAVFAAAHPEPRWALLDRYLVASEAAGIPALICVTKCDLAAYGEIAEHLQRYHGLGYRIARTACPAPPGEQQGLDELAGILRGRLSLLLGKSGVGKSTLINSLTGRQVARTSHISSKTGKGRHTTSMIEMIPLADEGSVIDTPGMREFALWEIPEQEVGLHFPEMRELIGSCRFRVGCTHVHEPGCAVKAALEEGRIHPLRYRSYLRITGRAPGMEADEA
jgi:ribosome biogenesis GTPase / thiamine phosphate phosphatase